MNDAHDNAQTDREMTERFTGKGTLADLVDGLTEEQATEILVWLARERPTALREAFRNSRNEKTRQAYISAGRPHP